MGFIENSYGSNPNLSQVNIDSDLNMQNYDIIGVKRFMCKDYLGALLAIASDNLQDTIYLNDVNNGERTKLFRVPSNFLSGSTIKIEYQAKGFGGATDFYVEKYDPLSETYTVLDTISISGTPVVWKKTGAISVNPGDLLTIHSDPTSPNKSSQYVYGSSGVNLYYDPNAASGAVWEVIDE